MSKVFKGIVEATLVLVLVLAAQRASAQDRTPQNDTGRDAAFVAVEGPARDSVPGGTLLVAAYGVVFGLVLLYVGRLAKLQSNNAKSIERLAALLERTATKNSSPPRHSPHDAG